MSSAALALAVFAPLAGGLLAARHRSPLRAGRWVAGTCGLATVAATWLLVAAGLEPGGQVGHVAGLHLRADRVSALLLVVALATATMVASFSRRSLDADARAGRFFALLGAVVTGAALVVVPGAGWVLLAGWLLSGWALVGLIGFADPWQPARRARRRVVRTLAVGDVTLVLAVVIAARTSDGLFTGDSAAAVAELRAATFSGVSALDVVAVALVVAGASRSALIPFHRWLVGTLVAPTPVSALVHAGLVSGAGLLLIRFAPAFVASDPAVILAFAVGVATALVASTASLMRSDVKGALAWSTVSQMAFMVVQCAVGAFSSAALHIAGHGMYKAALFLGAGDTPSRILRSRRRPRPVRLLPRPALWLVTAAAPTIAVGLAVWAMPPDVSPAGQVLVAVFAWLSTAFAVHGWLTRGPMHAVPAAIVAVAAAVAGSIAYVAGLRLVEHFVKPSLPTGTGGTIVGPTVLVTTIAVLAAAVAATAWLPGRLGRRLRDGWRRSVTRWTVAVERPAATPVDVPIPVVTADATQRAELRGDVADAAAIVAPLWPLSSFVAVNPLGGLEHVGFDAATATARRWLRARTHLSLAEHRRDHARDSITDDDLRHAVHATYSEACAGAPVVLAGRRFDPVDLIVADLLHGPEPAQVATARTALERRGADGERLAAVIDEVVATWLAEHVCPPAWPARRAGETFVAMCRRLAPADPRLDGVIAPSAARWIAELDDDPAAVTVAAFAAAGVDDARRIDEMRGHLARLAGWAGLAKWRTDWAHPDERHPDLAPVDVVAVRAMLEAAVLASMPATAATGDGDDLPTGADAAQLTARVDAVARSLAPAATDGERQAIAEVLAAVPDEARPGVWLRAHEHHVDEQFLAVLDRDGTGPTRPTPDVQMVFCIDVRSEGLRRHLEAFGAIETRGFAGFFGVPMRVKGIGWERAEARCPVLVAPAISAIERPRDDALGEVAAMLARRRSRDGAHHAHQHAKHGPGAAFALAEAAGWALGPVAMARTLVPGTARPFAAPPTTVRFDDDESLVEQRVFAAEAVLNTMGLVDHFAPLVVLCGHTSTTTNNAHATALECGACGGAAGDGNARAVAALLNSPEIRHHLVERGITIPDHTWFLAALHDTASDQVTLLDVDDAPASIVPQIDELRAQLALAGGRQSQVRAAHLPGPARRVRDRGADWAQVRPEWGLARNAAFVIGPRSMTTGLDLGGRAFLHDYDAELDPTGRVLETIMTAPLVVAHWISSQYYFSTVDPEVFGAGDKLLHNPLGATGVVSGPGGDLRVGLPLQSTHIDGERHHQPVRLLAVIQADLVRIERIINANPVLRTLTAGAWLRVAGRSNPHEPWSTRTAAGTWITTPRSRIDHDVRVGQLTPEHA